MKNTKGWSPTPNYGALILFKVLSLEAENEDKHVRPERKRRNDALIKFYIDELEYYEIRN